MLDEKSTVLIDLAGAYALDESYMISQKETE